jgi:uncharacterized protein YkwD
MKFLHFHPTVFFVPNFSISCSFLKIIFIYEKSDKAMKNTIKIDFGNKSINKRVRYDALIKVCGRLAVSVLISLTMVVQVLAAPIKMVDGQIFDPVYYAETNPDVVRVLGSTNVDSLYHHYQQYGQKEGRLPLFPDGKLSDEIPKLTKYDDDIIEITNKERQKNGLTVLSKSDQLMFDAYVRAKEQTVSFSHTRPDGTEWWTVDPEHMFGENLEWIKSDDAERAVKLWMESPGHRDNILNPKYTRIGVGHVVVGDRYYIVQNFE